jgi:hypothetical protein
MNAKGFGRKWSWPNIRYYASIRLERLRKTTKKINQHSQLPEPGYDPGSSWIWSRSVNHSNMTFSLNLCGERNCLQWYKMCHFFYSLAYLNADTLWIFFSVNNCYPFILPVFGPTWSDVGYVRLTHKAAFMSEIPRVKLRQISIFFVI